ncbi:NAD(P)-dependent oxidoreductase [Inquilinus limosus]|uniref:NAD(P)-dependent oxidoreductase n=1 Tax=Inquilinus limosus TaxID=171674 RepID=UPI000425791F|nr:NAD(P)-binding domain-containing protein [Inquilinus limosus]
MEPEISVIGTGRMGSALVRALLKQGYPTRVWNRTAERTAPLLALGAQAARTVAAAADAARIVIVNVSDYAASGRLLRTAEVEAALRGRLLLQLTSGSPGQAREAASWAARHGIDYLDGAIMATPNFIGEPGATILYSGPAALFERHRPVLLAFGGNPQHVGEDPGHASALDAALLVQMWGALFGALQGIAVCGAEGIPLAAYEAQMPAFKPVVDLAVADLVGRVRQGRLVGDEATLASVGAHHAAFRQLLELYRERGLDGTVPDAFDRVFRAAIAAGHDADDFAVLSRFVS